MSKSTWHPHKFQNLIKNTCFFVPGISQRYCVVWLTHIQDISHHYCKLSTTDLGWVYHSYLYTHICTYIYICMYMRVCIYICIHTQYMHRYKSIYTDTSQTYIQKGMKHADCFFVSWLWQNKCALKCVVFEQVEREVLRWTSSSNRLAGSQATCETH